MPDLKKPDHQQVIAEVIEGARQIVADQGVTGESKIEALRLMLDAANQLDR